MKHTLKTILLALIPGLIYLTGCTHTTPSPTTIDPTQLVGVWSYHSWQDLVTYHNTTIINNTQIYPVGPTVTFLGGGRFFNNANASPGAGYDSLVGVKLYITDTVNHTSDVETVKELTSHSLILSITYPSTGDTIGQRIFTFTR